MALATISDAVQTVPVWISRALRRTLLVLYWIAIFLGLDFIYSTFIYDYDEFAHISDPAYDHTVIPKFVGKRKWGYGTFPFITNSLGFKDGSARDVPLVPTTQRILLIGDSFTEGSLAFEESFAGMLYRAGQERTKPIEFLNAGLSSYSPIIYYRKIKYLIEQGLKFDAAVVVPDISDVWDEAHRYFCIDEDPRYFAYCEPSELEFLKQRRNSKKFLRRHFVITDKMLLLAKRELRRARGKYWTSTKEEDRVAVFYRNPIAGWTIPGFKFDEIYAVDKYYAPLGIEGGIARSLQNMQKLADLLAEHHIPLIVAVYPWPLQLAMNDRESRQIALYRDFCRSNCKEFIDAFPAFFAFKDSHRDWYERLFLEGDVHWTAEGNKLMYEALAKHLL
jgi:hypothetical protein